MSRSSEVIEGLKE
jgi:hypothetical protein